MHDVTEVVVVDDLEQLAEHGVALLLPRVEGIGLDGPAQVDAVLEVVHLGQVVAPAGVHDLEHHVTLDLAHRLGAARHRLGVRLVVVERLLDDALDEVLGRPGLLEVGGGELGRVVLGQVVDQTLEVPVLLELVRAVLRHQLLGHPGQQILGVLLEVVAVDDLQAPLVDHLALLVHHLVVLESVLADFGVAGLYRVLRPLDRLGHGLGLDRHVFGQGATHHPVHGAGGEEPQQLVFEAQVETALARVALAPRTAPQLVVDAPALVPLAAEDVEAAELAHLLPLGPAARQDRRLALFELGRAFLGVEVHALGGQLVLGQQLRVAAQDDVDAPTGHVGGDRHRAAAAGLRDDLGLAEVLLGVEDVVLHAALVEQAREQLGLGHRRGAHQDGLAQLVALDDVLDHRVELRLLGLEDEVALVRADHLHVGGNGDDRQGIGRRELPGLGLGRAGHARQLLVHAEVVLEGHRGPGVVLLLDGHALLRLDRLVETVGPPPTLQRAAGELVDDLHLAAGDEVVLVPVVEVLGGEGLGQLVHVVDRDGVVDVVHPDRLLHLLDPGLERDDRLLLLVHLVVDVAGQGAGDGGELVVELRRLVGGPRDDEGCAGLVDEDGVDLVDDGEDVAPLGHELARPRHVVAQVVEAELVVGPVGHVRGVRGPLGGRRRPPRPR